jgi:alkanesulfonate monooxygenase
MTSRRQLKLGAFMRPISIHTGAWRYPGAYPDANFNLAHIKRFAQTLERGRFDAFFMADHLAVLNMPVKALRRSHTVTSFEPFTLLSYLAGATERIGLIATASTTFDAPYHIARRFASLDHISNGRAGWNRTARWSAMKNASKRPRSSVWAKRLMCARLKLASG